MIKKIGLAVLLAMAPMAAFADDAAPAAAAPVAEAAAAAPEAHAGFSVDSTMGDLMANDAAKAVLEHHIPDVVSSPQIAMAASMSLRSLQAYVPTLTEEKLTEINTDLAAVH